MNKFKHKFQDSRGQALVEFALVITAVLMMIFLIIESARILWAWNTVQHAAREGARYAITGQFDGPNCAVDFGLDKFRQSPGRDVCENDAGIQTSANLRVASIMNEVHTNMAGLKLNETSTAFEDDEYYNIEVWGATEAGQILYDYAGVPGNPVIVRVTYQVPIITPFFRPIRTTMPVFGQEVLNNERFGQLGNTTGESLPPDLPPLPTPGVTPSPTPSPTPSDTPTPATDTPTATPTETPIPICEVQFEGNVVETQNFVWVTGDIGTTVQIVDLTTGGNIIGFGTLGGPFNNHACEGFTSISVSASDLVQGHVIAAISSDNSTDTTIVLGSPPTPSPTPSNTPLPTSTPSPTYTPTSSPTPNNPYIALSPSCGTPATNPGNISFNVSFINWPTNQSLTLSWEGVPELIWQAGQHNGSFTIRMTKNVPQQNDTYTVLARAGGGWSDTEILTVPCSDFPTPTPIGGATATPAPPDLVIVGPPLLITTGDIIAYQPVQFSVNITNAGDIDVDTQFFVDIYLDPNPSLVLSTTIPITESDGYSAVSSLAGGASRVITITSPLGFANEPINDHRVYGFVDSLEQVSETDETNNISWSLTPIPVTPAATPTPSPTPINGSSEISGGAFIFENGLVPQFRATLRLIDDSTGLVIASTSSDQNGFYQFLGVPPPTSTYTVSGCIIIDSEEYYGTATGIVPPNLTTYVFMFGGVPCP